MPDPAADGALGLAAFCGQVALVVSFLLIVASLLRVWPRARRVRRHARALDGRLRREQELLFDGLVLLVAQGIEMDRLLEPWRRILFWARHPLTLELWEQYFRRP